MEFELQYIEALKEHKLEVSALSKDARTGIDGINDLLKSVNAAEKQGRTVSQKSLDKIAAMDKWVYYEILDQVNDTDDNAAAAPVNVAAAIEEIKTEGTQQAAAATTDPNQSLGLSVEAELAAMHATGREEWDMDSIKAAAPKTHSALFESYKEDDENGVNTHLYSLIETDKHIFTLTKK